MRDIMWANGGEFKRAKRIGTKNRGLPVHRLLNAHHQLAPVRFG